MLPLLLFAAAIAQGAAQPQEVPPEVLDASAEWGLCRGNVAGPLIEGPLSPEEVADAAIAGCTAQERLLAEAGVRHFGPSWRGVVADFRLRYRAAMATRVREMRSGTPASEPHGAWGMCLGEGLQTVSRDEPAEAAADRLLAACAEHETRVRASFERRHGAESARTMVDTQRRMLRTRMIGEIRAARR
jgi:hypothetical protein